jgi:hypothetical protein
MRLKIFILTTMLITLISGVLFYKNLTQINPNSNVLKVDFDELRSIDQDILNASLQLRLNFQNRQIEMSNELNRTKEFMALVESINRVSPELKDSVFKILNHFKDRIDRMYELTSTLSDLKSNLQYLHPLSNEIEKKNIKYQLNKRDFYRECLIDAYMYVAHPHKDYENRLEEDVKILSQIVAISSAPMNEVKSYLSKLEGVLHNTKKADLILNKLSNNSIETEMKIIAKHYAETLEIQNEQNENLLTFMFFAIGIYILFMIFILKKN